MTFPSFPFVGRSSPKSEEICDFRFAICVWSVGRSAAPGLAL
jgi:hypothetical protein